MIMMIMLLMNKNMLTLALYVRSSLYDNDNDDADNKNMLTWAP